MRRPGEVHHAIEPVGGEGMGLAMRSAELAAYTMTANVLLNLDEVVTRE